MRRVFRHFRPGEARSHRVRGAAPEITAPTTPAGQVTASVCLCACHANVKTTSTLRSPRPDAEPRRLTGLPSCPADAQGA